jgi:hypothetical protein
VSSSKDPALESLYSSLLRQSSPHEKSIQKDLARTFPKNKFFQKPTHAAAVRLSSSTSGSNGDGGGGEPVKLSAVEERGRGQDELYNVIRAYSLYDPEVGYVQGSAFIVAALLLNVSRSPESWLLWSLGGLEEGRRADRGLIALRQMPDEEAFCVLVRLMHSVSSSHLLLLTLPLHFPYTSLTLPFHLPLPIPTSPRLFPPPSRTLRYSTASELPSSRRCLAFNSASSNSIVLSRSSSLSFTSTLFVWAYEAACTRASGS